VNIYEHVTVIS